MTDYTITQTAGAKAANSISADFTNTAGVVAGNTTWTTGSVLYLRPTDNTDYVVKSIGAHDTRDMEVTTWTRQGYVFLRLDGTGKAIYFFHNGESTNGTLEIGIITGLTEAAYPSGTAYSLYSNTDCVTSFGSAGYNKAGDTTGDTFTFGVSGFDIYVKFNGTEVCRFKEYRHMASGAMALKSSTLANNGFRDITHSTLSTVTLASDYANNEINMGDWGCRALATTGSISASSSSLTVASATGFQVGDYVLVEIDNESGGSTDVRGTNGVGGSWPKQHYTTTANLFAATPAANLFAWAEDTGEVWRYFNMVATFSGTTVTVAAGPNLTTSKGTGRVSFKTTGTLPSPLVAGTIYYVVEGSNTTDFQLALSAANAYPPPSGASPIVITFSGGTGVHRLNWVQTSQYDLLHYYPHKSLPRSLRGKITGIAGNVFTLDTASSGGLTGSGAETSATNANVYLDNHLYFNDVLQTVRSSPSLSPIAWAAMTVTIPAGNFRFGGEIYTSNRSGLVIQGQGQASTTLTSCDGMRGAGLFAQACPAMLVKDFTIMGNVGLNYYGLNFSIDTFRPTPGGSQYNSRGQIITVDSDNAAVFEDDFAANWIYSGTFIQQCNNSVVQDITGINVFTNVVDFQGSNDCSAYRCTAKLLEPHQSYTQWQFEFAGGTTGGRLEDCVIDHTYLGGGFESFGGVGQSFIRCSAHNASFSLNDAGTFLLQDCSVTIDADSIAPVWAFTNPAVVIGTNTGSANATLGGTIQNMNILISGYIDDDNNCPQGFTIGPLSQNVTITGGRYRAPNWASGNILGGPVGINSQAPGLTVIGFRACGQVQTPITAGQANISLASGSITNCIADSIWLGDEATGDELPLDGTNGNITCAAADALAPTTTFLLCQVCM